MAFILHGLLFADVKQRPLHAIKAPLCADMNSVQLCIKHDTSQVCRACFTTYASELMCTYLICTFFEMAL